MAVQRVRHDGVGWRMVVDVSQEPAAHVQIEALLPEAGWVRVQSWEVPGLLPRSRREQLTVAAREHGWMVVGGWGRVKAGTLIVEDLFPADWLQIVAEATSARRAAQSAAELADLGWRKAILSAVRVGWVSADRAAGQAGVTRGRIHQIISEHDRQEASKERIDEVTVAAHAGAEES